MTSPSGPYAKMQQKGQAMNASTEEDHGGARPSEYEFDAEQSKIIGDLASSMRWVAAPLLLLGILYVVASVLCLVQAFRQPLTILTVIYVGLIALLFLALGRWTRHAAMAFEEVVSTRGRDISNLMDALDNLRKTFSLLSLFVKIYVVLILFALIVGVIAALTGTMTRW